MAYYSPYLVLSLKILLKLTNVAINPLRIHDLKENKELFLKEAQMR